MVVLDFNFFVDWLLYMVVYFFNIGVRFGVSVIMGLLVVYSEFVL